MTSIGNRPIGFGAIPPQAQAQAVQASQPPSAAPAAQPLDSQKPAGAEAPTPEASAEASKGSEEKKAGGEGNGLAAPVGAAVGGLAGTVGAAFLGTTKGLKEDDQKKLDALDKAAKDLKTHQDTLAFFNETKNLGTDSGKFKNESQVVDHLNKLTGDFLKDNGFKPSDTLLKDEALATQVNSKLSDIKNAVQADINKVSGELPKVSGEASTAISTLKNHEKDWLKVGGGAVGVAALAGLGAYAAHQLWGKPKAPEGAEAASA